MMLLPDLISAMQKTSKSTPTFIYIHTGQWMQECTKQQFLIKPEELWPSLCGCLLEGANDF